MSSRPLSQEDRLTHDNKGSNVNNSKSQEDFTAHQSPSWKDASDVEKVDGMSDFKAKEDSDVLRRAGLAQDIPDGVVKRGLKERHLQLIALGGAIGTGLFIGLGTALSSAGPLSTLLGYSIMGVLVWMLMIAMGEMSAYLPVAGGFVHHCSRFVDPALGSALGLMYWFSYAITLPTEISACSLVVSYWDPQQTINPSIWISIVLVICVSVNFAPVRVYGEIESLFSIFKILVIVVLIVVMLVIDVGGGPSGEFIGGRYWHQPGSMAQLFWHADPKTGQPVGGISGAWGRFLAFWNLFVSAAFAYGGTEITGVTVGEVQNPRKNVPRAIKKVAMRIAIFYVLAVLMVGLVVPCNNIMLLSKRSDASASPFVIAIQSAGIKVLPDFVNGVLLTVTWSAGQSDLYAASRTLYGLALEGQAPRFLKKCTKSGVPIWAVAVTSLYAPLAYMGVGALGAARAFLYLYDMAAVSVLIVWWAILISYIRFYHGLKKQGISRDTLPYKAPFQPYASYFALIFFTLVMLFSAFTVFLKGQWAIDTFIVNYATIPIFFFIWLGYKIWLKSKVISLEDMDFITGQRALELLDEEEDDKDIKEKIQYTVQSIRNRFKR